MNAIKDIEEFTIGAIEEFAIGADVTTRMALFAMAKTLTVEEVEFAFNEINNSLTMQGGYESEKLIPITDAYKAAVLKISAGMDWYTPPPIKPEQKE